MVFGDARVGVSIFRVKNNTHKEEPGPHWQSRQDIRQVYTLKKFCLVSDAVKEVEIPLGPPLGPTINGLQYVTVE